MPVISDKDFRDLCLEWKNEIDAEGDNFEPSVRTLCRGGSQEEIAITTMFGSQKEYDEYVVYLANDIRTRDTRVAGLSLGVTVAVGGAGGMPQPASRPVLQVISPIHIATFVSLPDEWVAAEDLEFRFTEVIRSAVCLQG